MPYGFDNETVAGRIKALRIKRNLSHRELGTAIGVTNTAISKWENAQRVPSAENIFNLAKFFNVTAGHLIGMEN